MSTGWAPPLTMTLMFDGLGSPFVPGSMAQMQLRVWSPKNSAPWYAAGYEVPV